MGRWGERCDLGKKAQRASLALIVTLTMLLSVAAVALGCGDDGGSPEATMQQWLTALGNQDIETMVDLTTSPEDLAALEAMGMTKDDLKYSADAEMLASYGKIEFSDVTMETKQDGDNAVVTITGGSMTVQGVTMDLNNVEAVGFPTEFYLYRVDGKWYIDMEG